MPNTLSPSRVIEIIDRTFRVYQENFITFVALVSVFTIPINALSFFLNRSVERQNPFAEDFFTTSSTTTSSSTGTQAENIFLLILSLLGTFLTVVIVHSLICHITSENILGRQARIGDALPRVAGRFITLGVAIIVGGILFGITAVALSIGSICIVPAFLFPLLFFLGLSAYFFIVPVVVLEDVDFWTGLRRALSLGKVRFWKVFGFFIGTYLIIGVMRVALFIFTALIVGMTFSGEDIFFPSSDEASIISTILSTAIAIFIAPILPIGLTLMYYDTRIRVEGLDLVLEYAGTPEPRPSDVVSPDPPSPWLNSQDIVNVVILTLSVIGLCGIFYGGIFAFVLLAGTA